MVMVVICTFFGTRATNFHASFREDRYVRTVPGDCLTEEAADIGTIAVETDTVRHVSDMLFIKAGIETFVTGHDTGI